MNLDFFAKTETLKEKIPLAREKTKEFTDYLNKKRLTDLMISSYMYLKIINSNARCLEKLKSEYGHRRKKTIDSLAFNFNFNNLSSIPPYSFVIEFEFTLEKPYISRDDENFTIIENSIKREKVLGCPYIPGSTWKGCLRSALWQEGMKGNDKQIVRIFGNERQDKENFRQGRLRFFPTFFSKSDFEIINPHDRKTRTGTKAILIECVPIDEKGKFSLLYVPFDLIGKEQEEIKNQTLEDLKLIVKGLKAMFTVYGFGAKTSSGYGLASKTIKNGKLYADISIEIEKETEAIELPKDFRKYLNENGSIRNELVDSETGKLLSNKRFQEKKSGLGFESGNEFSKFKRWYEENGEAYRNQLKVKGSPKNLYEFTGFDELIDMLKNTL